jgi:hypothetical protein
MFGQFELECDGAVVLGVVDVPGVVVVPLPEAAYATPPPTPIETTTAASAAYRAGTIGTLLSFDRVHLIRPSAPKGSWRKT